MDIGRSGPGYRLRNRVEFKEGEEACESVGEGLALEGWLNVGLWVMMVVVPALQVKPSTLSPPPGPYFQRLEIQF